ncbi:MAG: hypothetical protein AAGJ35_12605, partial [Myxococcota bacterium]
MKLPHWYPLCDTELNVRRPASQEIFKDEQEVHNNKQKLALDPVLKDVLNFININKKLIKTIQQQN